MKKRYIVGINSMTEEQEKAFLEYISSNEFAWWHWINNLWLIVDRSGKLTAEKLRNDLLEIAPDERNLVIEAGGNDCYGFGPKGEKRNMFKWLNNTWYGD